MAAGDLKGLIAWLKENQDRASAGTQGVGGSSHIGGAFFQSATGTRFQFVPYRGGAPAIQDLVAGQIDLMVAALGDCLEQVRAGNIRAYAVTAAGRLAATPDVPTVDEAGLPASTSPIGSLSGRQRARRRATSQSSTPRLLKPCPIHAYAHGSPTLARRYSRASSRRPRP
jgi:Tripartite tricarboxylate transporter family receptor